MKRRIVTLLICLLLGAIVNIAVAWGCAIWVQPEKAVYRFGDDRSQGSQWTIARFDAFGTTLLFSDRTPDHGERLPRHNFASPASLTPEWTGLSQPLPRFATDSTILSEYRIVDGRGWPLRALALDCAALTLVGAVSPVITKRWMIDLDPSMSSPIEWGGWGTYRSLPLRAIWPGFAINTLFYAAILWLLLAAPFALRRWRRIKRGLCPACAYPIGTSPVCTECGVPIPSLRGGGPPD